MTLDLYAVTLSIPPLRSPAAAIPAYDAISPADSAPGRLRRIVAHTAQSNGEFSFEGQRADSSTFGPPCFDSLLIRLLS